MAYLLLVLWFCSYIMMSSPSTQQQMVGREYNQMHYLPTSFPIDQFTVGSKLLCVAQCARQFPTCNIVVFNRAVSPPCMLFSEPLVSVNLAASLDAVVVDFGRINSSAGMQIEISI
jgi:hypothetical protein